MVRPGWLGRAVPAALGGQVDDHGARAHRCNHRLGDEDRRRPTRNLRSGDDDVGTGDVLGDQRLLALKMRRRQTAFA